jgi:hypothetical protein
MESFNYPLASGYCFNQFNSEKQNCELKAANKNSLTFKLLNHDTPIRIHMALFPDFINYFYMSRRKKENPEGSK